MLAAPADQPKRCHVTGRRPFEVDHHPGIHIAQAARHPLMQSPGQFIRVLTGVERRHANFQKLVQIRSQVAQVPVHVAEFAEMGQIQAFQIEVPQAGNTSVPQLGIEIGRRSRRTDLASALHAHAADIAGECIARGNIDIGNVMVGMTGSKNNEQSSTGQMEQFPIHQ